MRGLANARLDMPRVMHESREIPLRKSVAVIPTNLSREFWKVKSFRLDTVFLASSKSSDSGKQRTPEIKPTHSQGGSRFCRRLNPHARRYPISQGQFEFSLRARMTFMARVDIKGSGRYVGQKVEPVSLSTDVEALSSENDFDRGSVGKQFFDRRESVCTLPISG